MINTRVNVDVRYLDLDYVTIDEAIAQLTKIRDSIPESYLSSVRIEHDYTDEGIEWVVYYYRKPTKKELADKDVIKKQQLQKRRDELARQLKQVEEELK